MSLRFYADSMMEERINVLIGCTASHGVLISISFDENRHGLIMRLMSGGVCWQYLQK